MGICNFLFKKGIHSSHGVLPNLSNFQVDVEVKLEFGGAPSKAKGKNQRQESLTVWLMNNEALVDEPEELDSSSPSAEVHYQREARTSRR